MSSIPQPDAATAWQVVHTWRRHRHILSALEVLHERLGDVFRLPVPGFQSVVLVGPEANRFLLVEARENVRWRAEHDPVTRLLRHGILVTDGASHDTLRQMMSPSLHRNMVEGYLQTMGHSVDQISHEWREGARIDLLPAMRRIALLILTDTLFGADFTPHLSTLWDAILGTIRYISPGPWLLWPGIPRKGDQQALRQMDEYLYRLIALRRAHPGTRSDLLGSLIDAGLTDDLIRDQLLTMFIAGHDTSTALLAWSLHLLSTHPDILARVYAEVDAVVGTQMPTAAHIRQLRYLDSVIKETLRLYPPIHLGSRIAATEIEFQGYPIAAGTRVVYSPYLTHRDHKYWPEAERFDPERFAADSASHRPTYTFLPFGGGPRNCIGAAFALVEVKLVLARLLQHYAFPFVGGSVRPRMRATLEPNPGVLVEVRRRS